VTAVVDEAAVFDHLFGPGRSGGTQPRRHRRSAASRIDHEVGQVLFAAIGAHAGDVHDAVGTGRGEHARHANAAADRNTRRLGGQAGDDRLANGSTGSDEVVALVLGAPPAGELVGHADEWVHAQRPGSHHRLGQTRKLGLGNFAELREEEVEHLELIDASSIPAFPSRLGRRGRSGVTLENGHVVTVVGQHHGRTQADHAAACKHDSSHCFPSRPVQTVSRCRHG
jgi:hypothetical protein